MKQTSCDADHWHIVIAGGGYAGVSAALRLARRRLPYTRITLINDTGQFVERIRVHQRAVGQEVGVHSLARLLRGTGVRIQIGEAKHIDPVGRSLSLNDDTQIAWDQLVLALGSMTDTRNVPGAALHATVLGPNTIQHIHQRLIELRRTHGRVLVAGAGLTGIETAAEIAEAFPEITVDLVSRSALGADFSESARQYLKKVFAKLNVRVHERTAVLSVQEHAAQTDRGDLPFDLCLWNAGFYAHPLARTAGFATNEQGQVIVDEQLRSISHPHVRVAGDLASPNKSAKQYIPQGCKSAMPMGAQVADSIVADTRAARAPPFTFHAPFFCVSLGRRDGLIQMTDTHGRPCGRIITGRSGARFKEFICSSTVWALKLERIGFSGIQWIRGTSPGVPDTVSKSA